MTAYSQLFGTLEPLVNQAQEALIAGTGPAKVVITWNPHKQAFEIITTSSDTAREEVQYSLFDHVEPFEAANRQVAVDSAAGMLFLQILGSRSATTILVLKDVSDDIDDQYQILLYQEV